MIKLLTKGWMHCTVTAQLRVKNSLLLYFNVEKCPFVIKVFEITVNANFSYINAMQ